MKIQRTKEEIRAQIDKNLKFNVPKENIEALQNALHFDKLPVVDDKNPYDVNVGIYNWLVKI